MAVKVNKLISFKKVFSDVVVLQPVENYYIIGFLDSTNPDQVNFYLYSRNFYRLDSTAVSLNSNTTPTLKEAVLNLPDDVNIPIFTGANVQYRQLSRICNFVFPAYRHTPSHQKFQQNIPGFSVPFYGHVPHQGLNNVDLQDNEDTYYAIRNQNLYGFPHSQFFDTTSSIYFLRLDTAQEFADSAEEGQWFKILFIDINREEGKINKIFCQYSNYSVEGFTSPVNRYYYTGTLPLINYNAFEYYDSSLQKYFYGFFGQIGGGPPQNFNSNSQQLYSQNSPCIFWISHEPNVSKLFTLKSIFGDINSDPYIWYYMFFIHKTYPQLMIVAFDTNGSGAQQYMYLVNLYTNTFYNLNLYSNYAFGSVLGNGLFHIKTFPNGDKRYIIFGYQNKYQGNSYDKSRLRYIVYDIHKDNIIPFINGTLNAADTRTIIKDTYMVYIDFKHKDVLFDYAACYLARKCVEPEEEVYYGKIFGNKIYQTPGLSKLIINPNLQYLISLYNHYVKIQKYDESNPDYISAHQKIDSVFMDVYQDGKYLLGYNPGNKELFLYQYIKQKDKQEKTLFSILDSTVSNILENSIVYGYNYDHNIYFVSHNGKQVQIRKNDKIYDVPVCDIYLMTFDPYLGDKFEIKDITFKLFHSKRKITIDFVQDKSFLTHLYHIIDTEKQIQQIIGDKNLKLIIQILNDSDVQITEINGEIYFNNNTYSINQIITPPTEIIIDLGQIDESNYSNISNIFGSFEMKYNVNFSNLELSLANKIRNLISVFLILS